MKLRLISALVLLAVGACATPGPQWQKPNTDEAQQEADLALCRRAARDQVMRAYSPDRDVVRPIGPSTSIDDPMRQADQARRERAASDRNRTEMRMVDECMRERGYKPASAEK
jgi:hypothetical protein